MCGNGHAECGLRMARSTAAAEASRGGGGGGQQSRASRDGQLGGTA